MSEINLPHVYIGHTEMALMEAPVEVRAEREARMLAEIDNRTPLEKLFDRIAAARLTHYRPDQPPSLRQDIVCFSCGYPYRPDDVLDGENVFLCGNCILSRKEQERDEQSGF